MRKDVVFMENLKTLSLNTHLHSLEEQRRRLKLLNRLLENDVPDDWFDDIDTHSNHIQSVRDLEYLFVVPSPNFLDTLNYQLSLAKASLQCSIIFFGEFGIGFDDAALSVNADMSLYKKPGIFKLRIDLMSGWDSNIGRSVDDFRYNASRNGTVIDCIPAIGAYAAQSPSLFKAQDGVTMPFFDLADIQIGDGHDYVPELYYSRNKIYLDLIHCEQASFTHSIPTRVFSQN